MNQNGSRWYVLLPWVPVVVALYDQRGGAAVESIDAGWATIIAAVIAGGIAILAMIIDLVKTWRNSKTIGDIRNITADKIKPKVDSIDSRTEKQADKIDILISDLDHRKRMEAQFPKEASALDMISSGTSKVLDEFQKLNQQYLESQKEITALKVKNHDLVEKCNRLSVENAKLRGQVQSQGKGLPEKHDYGPTFKIYHIHDDWEPEP